MAVMLDAVTAVLSGAKVWWWGLSFTVGGVVFILIGIWHEIGWWMRRSWRRTSGTVVRLVKFPGGRIYSPEIQYLHDGTEHLFLSKYYDNHPPNLGDSVEIRVHPSG